VLRRIDNTAFGQAEEVEARRALNDADGNDSDESSDCNVTCNLKLIH